MTCQSTHLLGEPALFDDRSAGLRQRRRRPTHVTKDTNEGSRTRKTMIRPPSISVFSVNHYLEQGSERAGRRRAGKRQVQPTAACGLLCTVEQSTVLYSALPSLQGKVTVKVYKNNKKKPS